MANKHEVMFNLHSNQGNALKTAMMEISEQILKVFITRKTIFVTSYSDKCQLDILW